MIWQDGQFYPGRGEREIAGVTGVYSEFADQDTFVCQFFLKFLSIICLSAKRKGKRHFRAAICDGSSQRGGDGGISGRAEIIRIKRISADISGKAFGVRIDIIRKCHGAGMIMFVKEYFKCWIDKLACNGRGYGSL